MSAIENLQKRFDELAAKKESLEKSQRLHEQQARSDQAERDSVKLEMAQLQQSFTDARALGVLDKCRLASEAAQKHAEAHANALAGAVQEANKMVADLRAELGEVQAQRKLLAEQVEACQKLQDELKQIQESQKKPE